MIYSCGFNLHFPDLSGSLSILAADLNNIKFSAYRTAMKLRRVQKALRCKFPITLPLWPSSFLISLLFPTPIPPWPANVDGQLCGDSPKVGKCWLWTPDLSRALLFSRTSRLISKLTHRSPLPCPFFPAQHRQSS